MIRDRGKHLKDNGQKKKKTKKPEKKTPQKTQVYLCKSLRKANFKIKVI